MVKYGSKIPKNTKYIGLVTRYEGGTKLNDNAVKNLRSIVQTSCCNI